MFGSKQIADLKALVGLRTDERDESTRRAERAEGNQARIAALFTDGHTLGWSEAARQEERAEGLQNVLGRHARLLKACVGYRKQITQLAIDLKWKTARVAALEANLADRYAPGSDRAITPAEPKPVDEQTARELADARRLLAAQAETIRQLQDTNEAHYRDSARRAGASPKPKPEPVADAA